MNDSRPPLVKICGVVQAHHARTAASLGADFIGMVFAPSRRQVTMGQAAKIAAALGKTGAGYTRGPATVAVIEGMLAQQRPLLVGVFADQDPDTINSIAGQCRLDIIQLSGSETWEMCGLLSRPVLKCLKVSSDHTAGELLADIAPEAIPVLDAFVEGVYGGSGRTLDWEVAAEVAQQLPIMLAGGLTPENVSEAVRTVRPWAVDVSSGVETDGAKDVNKVRRFIAAVRGASQ